MKAASCVHASRVFVHRMMDVEPCENAEWIRRGMRKRGGTRSLAKERRGGPIPTIIPLSLTRGRGRSVPQLARIPPSVCFPRCSRHGLISALLRSNRLPNQTACSYFASVHFLRGGHPECLEPLPLFGDLQDMELHNRIRWHRQHQMYDLPHPIFCLKKYRGLQDSFNPLSML